MKADGDFIDLDVLSLRLVRSIVPAPDAPAQSSASASSDPLPVVPDWVQLPWLLHDHWPQIEGSAQEQSRQPAGTRPGARAGPCEEGAQDTDLLDMSPDEVWGELANVRARWQGHELAKDEHLTIIERCGAWTYASRGGAADSCRAKRETGLATRFCALYSLHKTASFCFALYGEHVAYQLAQCWVHRMQFWMDIWIERGQFSTTCVNDTDKRLYCKSELAIDVERHGDQSALSRLQQVLAIAPRNSPNGS